MEVIVIPGKLTHEEFCKKVYEHYGDKFDIVSEYKGCKKPITIRHNKCGTLFNVMASKLSTMNGNILCPCEYGKRFDKDVNSIYAMDKEFAKLLANPEDAFKYTVRSSAKVDFNCPHCNNLIKNKRIADVYERGLTCRHCSDNIPFAERLMYSLLEMKSDMLDNNQFTFDKTFDWS